MENTVTMLPTLKIEGKTIKQTLKKCEIEILKLTSLKESLEQENDDFSKKDKWIDWIGKYQKRLSIEGEKTEKEQREFLNQVITKIDVKMKNKKEHIFDIHFKLPIVKDTLNKKKVIEAQNTLTLTDRTI